MKMAQLRQKAKPLGINPGKMKKTALIHAVQKAEGNNPCYDKSNGQCDQLGCCFRSDCLKTKL